MADWASRASSMSPFTRPAAAASMSSLANNITVPVSSLWDSVPSESSMAFTAWTRFFWGITSAARPAGSALDFSVAADRMACSDSISATSGLGARAFAAVPITPAMAVRVSVSPAITTPASLSAASACFCNSIASAGLLSLSKGVDLFKARAARPTQSTSGRVSPRVVVPVALSGTMFRTHNSTSVAIAWFRSARNPALTLSAAASSVCSSKASRRSFSARICDACFVAMLAAAVIRACSVMDSILRPVSPDSSANAVSACCWLVAAASRSPALIPARAVFTPLSVLASKSSTGAAAGNTASNKPGRFAGISGIKSSWIC